MSLSKPQKARRRRRMACGGIVSPRVVLVGEEGPPCFIPRGAYERMQAVLHRAQERLEAETSEARDGVPTGNLRAL